MVVAIFSPFAALVGLMFIGLGVAMREAMLKQTGYALVAFAVLFPLTLI